jgi:hypothetical protein
MKKLLLTLAAASVMLVACKKEEAVEPTKTSEAPKATITGKLYAETNPTNTTRETAPDGIKVVATASHNGNTYRYETTSAGGSYKLEIPCNNDGVNLTIQFSDFVADETQPAGSDPGSKSRVWTTANVSVDGLVGGVSKVRDVTYSYED